MRLVVKMSFVMLMLIVVATGCGGGGDDVSPSTPPTTPTEPETPQAGSNAPYTVSVVDGSVGAAVVSVGADAITVRGRTVQLESATQVGFQSGHHRAFDTPGATSGPALDVHFFGDNSDYDYVRFGSWATGTVSPNPGFTIEDYGAFLAPKAGSGLTPVTNMYTAGTATYQGHYAGYVDTQGVGVSQVVGVASLVAYFASGVSGDRDGAINLELLPPDPARSSYATPELREYASDSSFAIGGERVLMGGPIMRNTFEVEVGATHEVLPGIPVPRGDSIGVLHLSGTGLCRPTCLYPQDAANTGGMQGGFFGLNAEEVGGTYQFQIGRTRAAGAFGATLQ